MYMVLGQEIANVDRLLFTQVAYFKSDVLAMPLCNLSFATKSMPVTEHDDVDSYQNTMVLTFDVRDADITSESFSPEYLYERENKKYVELRHMASVGVLTMEVFFLVSVNDCEFAYYDDDNDLIECCSLDELQQAKKLVAVS